MARRQPSLGPTTLTPTKNVATTIAIRVARAWREGIAGIFRLGAVVLRGVKVTGHERFTYETNSPLAAGPVHNRAAAAENPRQTRRKSL